MLHYFVDAQALDEGKFLHLFDTANPITNVVQQHKPDGDHDEHQVELAEELGPPGVQTGCGLVDPGVGELCRNPGMTLPTGFLQVSRVNRRGRIGVRQDPVGSMT